MTFGFGLEQVDATTRSELLKRSLELPAADHAPTPRRRRSSASSTRRRTLTATPADPVEVDVTAYDERGDLKLGQPVRRRRARRAPSRCSRSSSATRRRPRPSATTVTLTARGRRQGRQQVRRRTCTSTSPRRDAHGRCRRCRSTRRRLIGSPTVGSTLSCINGGFTNAPDDARRSRGCATASRSPAPPRRPTRSPRRHRPRRSRARCHGHQRAAPARRGRRDAGPEAAGPSPRRRGPPGHRSGRARGRRARRAGAAGAGAPARRRQAAGRARAIGRQFDVRVPASWRPNGKSIACTVAAVAPTSSSAKLTSTARLAGLQVRRPSPARARSR